MSSAIDRCKLELTGYTVLTEAANGAYVVTPVLAAMAGADVYALGARTAYGSADEIQNVTLELAKLAGVADRIQIILDKELHVRRSGGHHHEQWPGSSHRREDGRAHEAVRSRSADV